MAFNRRHNEPNTGEITVQARAGIRLVGQRLIEQVRDVLGVDFKEFIEAQWMFIMATSDDEARMDCSYRGGMPGFVRVVDSKTLLFPDYNGNGSFMSLGNLTVNPHIGMLFIDFEKQRRLRVNGHAEIVGGSCNCIAVSRCRSCCEGHGRSGLSKLLSLHSQDGSCCRSAGRSWVTAPARE